MTPLRRALMAGSVFFLALATGHVMQHGSAIAARLGMAEPTETQVIPTEGTAPGALRAIEDTHSAPTMPEDQGATDLSRPDLPRAGRGIAPDVADPMSRQNARSPLGLPCELGASAAPGRAGQAKLNLDAPCYAGARVLVQHGALLGSYPMSRTGSLSLDWPALSREAAYSFRFEDGVTLTAEALVPEADDVVHAALIWRGPADLGLHAFERDGAADTAGHVHIAEPHGPGRAVHVGRGYMTELGADSAWRSQVYTYPIHDPRMTAAVDLTVEARSAAGTCGTEARFQTLLSTEAIPQEITLDLPDCSRGDAVLVLKNLFPTLKVAAER